MTLSEAVDYAAWSVERPPVLSALNVWLCVLVAIVLVLLLIRLRARDPLDDSHLRRRAPRKDESKQGLPHPVIGNSVAESKKCSRPDGADTRT